MDLAETLKTSLSDRLKDPFMGSLFLFLLLQHWEIFFYALSSDSVPSKISAIRGELNDWWSNGRALLFALIFTIVSGAFRTLGNWCSELWDKVFKWGTVHYAFLDKDYIDTLQYYEDLAIGSRVINLLICENTNPQILQLRANNTFNSYNANDVVEFKRAIFTGASRFFNMNEDQSQIVNDWFRGCNAAAVDFLKDNVNLVRRKQLFERRNT